MNAVQCSVHLWLLAQDPGVGLAVRIYRGLQDCSFRKGQTLVAAYLSDRCCADAVLCALPVAELSHQLSLAPEHLHLAFQC